MPFLGRRRGVGHEEALRAHLERYFGTIEHVGGWPPSDGHPMVLSFPDRPAAGLTTLVTFGLSHVRLSSAIGSVREELACSVLTAQADVSLAHRLALEAAFIQQVGQAVLPDAVGRIGESVGPRTSIRAFWACEPDRLGAEFGNVEGTNDTFRIVQVVPLKTGEHDRAQMVGGHQFGHEVSDRWAELTDLDRQPLFEPVGPPGGFHWTGLVDFDAKPADGRVSREAIGRLRRGDLAKLGFMLEPLLDPGPTTERMWVEITNAGPELVGRLANDPVYLNEIPIGTEVHFGPQHVFDIRPIRDT
jgi:hypothetical protein